MARPRRVIWVFLCLTRWACSQGAWRRTPRNSGATVGDGVRTALHRSSGTPAHMSQTQILVLGAIAGLTIFIGLPVGRLGRLPISASTFLAATATGILLFLLWDVLAAGVEPV